MIRTIVSSVLRASCRSRSRTLSLQLCKRSSKYIIISSSLPVTASRRLSSSSIQYWNRETSKPQDFDTSMPITEEARILSLSDPDDTANDPVNKALHDPTLLPEGAKVLAAGASIEDFDWKELQKQKPNVVFVSHPLARNTLATMLQELPSLTWIHARSAGLDFIASDALAQSNVTLSNAKGTFSSTLAEYTLLAVSYFAKDLPRLLRQKSETNWERYPILEVRGATLGVIGYGDIGHACARLAKAYGMRVIAVRRNPKSKSDELCDAIYGNDTASLNTVFSESDYVVVSTPLTKETRGMIGREQFEHAKDGTVLINVGRGPIIDEDAMIEALKNGNLKGAGLDVFSTEPLPAPSELWKLENVLLSPHNMDATDTFMLEATQFFVEENLPRFLRGIPVLNVADKAAGY